MKKLFILLISICFAATSNAQFWTYTKPGTATLPLGVARDICTTNDGVISCGDFNSGTDGEIYVVKNDSLGNVLWEVEIDTEATVQRIAFVPSDSGFIISGIINETGDPYVFKLDSAGTWFWHPYLGLYSKPNAQIYTYQLPDDNIGIVVADNDGYDTIRLYIVSNLTGDWVGYEHNSMADYLYPGLVYTTTDITSDADGNFIITGYFDAVDSIATFILRLAPDVPSFTVEMAAGGVGVGIGGGGLGPFYPEQIFIKSDGNYLLTGYEHEGIFPDDSLISVIYNIHYSDGMAEFERYNPGNLLNSWSSGIIEYPANNYKVIRYNYAGDSYGLSPEDHIDISSLNNSLDEVSYQTIAYPPQNTINCISNFQESSYVIGGSFWETGEPSDYTIISTDDAGIIPDCIFNCVWPGDANNSGLADMDDLLTLGLTYGLTGPPRVDADNVWYGHAAEIWADTLADGTNDKYADCDGNGIINADDTTAISLNYGATHPIIALKTTGTDPEIYLDPATDTLPLGIVNIPIMLSDVADPVELYGLKFSIVFDGDEIIDSTTMQINFDDCWIGTAAEILTMQKSFPLIKTVDAGITRIDHTDVTGSGQIGTLSFVVIDNIAGKLSSAEKTSSSELNITINNIRAMQYDETEVALNGSTYTFALLSDVYSSAQGEFLLYPNPVSDGEFVIVTPDHSMIDRLIITDLLGREVYSIQAVLPETSIKIPNLEPGEYTVKALCATGMFTSKLSVLH